MLSQNPRQKLTTNIIYLTGVGAIIMTDGRMVGVQVIAMFVIHDWHFIIHHDLDYPDHFSVTEASTGTAVLEYCTATPQEAFNDTYNLIDAKKYYLSTTTGRILLKTQTNLFKHNSCIITVASYL